MGDSARKRRKITFSEVLRKQAKTAEDKACGSRINDDLDNEVVSPKELLIKLFEGGTGDWEMIGSDGLAVKFHQNILSAQVAHFRTLFSHEETLECERKQIVIPEDLNISQDGVEGLLRFIYYQDQEQMETSFKMTCCLIRAAHYYHIPKLVKAATKVIKDKFDHVAGNWFSVHELWTLFQQVWLWEESHPHKAELIDSVVAVIKRICQNKEEQTMDELLPVTNGNPMLRDLMIRLAQDSPRPVSPQLVPPTVSPPNSRQRLARIMALYRGSPSSASNLSLLLRRESGI